MIASSGRPKTARSHRVFCVPNLSFSGSKAVSRSRGERQPRPGALLGRRLTDLSARSAICTLDVLVGLEEAAQAEQKREAQELINSENLNAEAAKRYITTSLKREFASDNGTELNAILPKMSPLNPQYLTKKQSVFQKVVAFVEKFKGVGGQV